MNSLSIPIKQLPFSDRPREKLMRLGPQSLTSSELMALILRSGTRDSSALDLSHHLLTTFGGLNNIARTSHAQLLCMEGIGEVKASVIIAAFELGRRRLMDIPDRTKLKSPSAIARYARPRLIDKREEHLMVLYLNTSCDLLSEQLVSIGGTDTVIVDPKVILREAIANQASRIAIIHNHPSGSVKPSPQDYAVTRKLIRATDAIDCKMIDHVIVSERGYYSFSERGKLDEMKRAAFRYEMTA